MTSDPDPDQIAIAVQALGEAAQSTERGFQAIATRLEDGLSCLADINGAFTQLRQQWEAADVAAAERDLADAVAQVGEALEVQSVDGRSLDQLLGLVDAMPGHITRLASPIGYIATLAVNARLASVEVGDGDAGVLEFAAQIGQTLRRMQSCFAALKERVAALQAACAAADAARAVLPSGDANGAMARRVSATLGGAEARRTTTSRSCEAVAARAGAMQRQISDAVRAMQLGDITRQRVEHVHQIASLLAKPPPGAPIALGWAIATAQLLDTATQLDQEAARIRRALDALTGEAREIATVSTAAFGGGNGSYLGILQADVRQIGEALLSIHSVGTRADMCIQAAQRANAEVVAEIARLRELEVEIHLTGLNASFRCARLGSAGRSLSVIAQMVRHCGRDFAAIAQIIRARVDEISDVTNRLSDPQRHGALREVGRLVATMTAAARKLTEADDTLVAQLGRMDASSSDLSELLGEGLTAFSVEKQIGATLRRWAEQTAAWSRAPSMPEGHSTSARAELLNQFRALYTMDSERMVQGEITGEPYRPAEASAPEVSTDLDAMFL